MQKFWLLKSEPHDYSIDDLKKDGKTEWTGVRNYQARNYLRDQFNVGDQVLFYHSNTDPSVVGRAEVCSPPYPDFSAFDPVDSHFDAHSTPAQPTWFLIDICFKEKFKTPLSLTLLKSLPELEGMVLTRKGSRLSVQPVSQEHFQFICALAAKS